MRDDVISSEYSKPRGLSVLAAFRFIFPLLVLLSLSVSSASAATVLVGAGQGQTTIQGGINVANESDTVYVLAGTYAETLEINKSLTLMGASKTASIIDGQGNSIITLTNNTPGVAITISNFTIHHGSTGITTTGYNDVTILDNILENITVNAAAQVGHGGVNSNRTSVINNTIKNCGSGSGVIQMSDSSNATVISGNEIINTTIGIYVGLETSDVTITITNNNFEGIDTYFIQNTHAQNITAEGNYFGTTDYSTIATNISDVFDDVTVGSVDFCPLLSSTFPGGTSTRCTPNLLYNPSFEYDNNMNHFPEEWWVNSTTGIWSTTYNHTGARSIYLHEEREMSIYQEVNISSVASKEYNLTVWMLRVQDSPGFDGNASTFFFVYNTTSGRSQIDVMEHNVTANSTWYNFTGNVTFPSDADTFIGLNVTKHGPGSFYYDDFSLVYSRTYASVNTAPGAPSFFESNVTADTTPFINWTKGTDVDENDNVTTHLCFNGTAFKSASASCVVYANTTATNYTVTTALSNGTYYVSMWSSDDAAATSGYRNQTLRIGNAMPSVPSSLSPGNASIGYNLEVNMTWVTGTESDGDVRHDGWQFSNESDFTPLFASDADITEAEANQSTMASLNYTTYYWRVRTCDDSGLANNCSAWVTRQFVVNRVPTISIAYPSQGMNFTESQYFDVNVSVTDDETVYFNISINGVYASPNANISQQQWNYSSNGTHTINATAWDKWGGVNSDQVTVNVLDVNQPPNVTMVLPTENTTWREFYDYTISASVADNDGDSVQYNISIDGSVVATNASYVTNWTYADAGYHDINITAWDRGNVSITHRMMYVHSLGTTLAAYIKNVPSSVYTAQNFTGSSVLYYYWETPGLENRQKADNVSFVVRFLNSTNHIVATNISTTYDLESPRYARTERQFRFQAPNVAGTYTVEVNVTSPSGLGDVQADNYASHTVTVISDPGVRVDHVYMPGWSVKNSDRFWTGLKVYSNYPMEANATIAYESALTTSESTTKSFRLYNGNTWIGWYMTAQSPASGSLVNFTVSYINPTTGSVSTIPNTTTVTIDPKGVLMKDHEYGYVEVYSNSSNATANLTVYNVTYESVSGEVKVYAGAEGAILRGLSYLTGYPHGCIEQITSPLLANIWVKRYYDFQNSRTQSDVDNTYGPRVQSAVNSYLEPQQKSDGGWGWFRSYNPTPFFTGYALYGMAVAANDSDYGNWSSNVTIENAVGWLIGDMDSAGFWTGKGPDYARGNVTLSAFNMMALEEAKKAKLHDANKTLINSTLQTVANHLILAQKGAGGWAIAQPILRTHTPPRSPSSP